MSGNKALRVMREAGGALSQWRALALLSASEKDDVPLVRGRSYPPIKKRATKVKDL